MERREFLKRLASATAGLMLTGARTGARGGTTADRLGPLLPRRKLGSTGQAVTMLGVGGWHLGHMSERDAQETIEASLEGGVRFFDTAETYQSGGSERRLGKLLVPKYRDVVFLMTKTTARDGATARRHLEASLRRLNTDRLDLWQVHSLESPADVDARLRDGVLDAMREAREAGKVRFIGFTGHRKPSAHERMLAKTRVFDTCQMPVNLVDPGYESFIENVLPTLVERKMGVLAMKSLSGGGFFPSRGRSRAPAPRPIPDRVTVAEAISFVWSLPVSVLISGADDAAQMREKIALARRFSRMDTVRRRVLIEKVADLAGPKVEWYKR
jgi:aryl-alcohol dehydrogenase-like predicted oxidoreductase